MMELYLHSPESIVLSFRERERKRESGGGSSERDYNSGEGVRNNIFGLKVPRHFPLVLLIGVRLEFRINSTMF
jgi:hypothetical protein